MKFLNRLRNILIPFPKGKFRGLLEVVEIVDDSRFPGECGNVGIVVGFDQDGHGEWGYDILVIPSDNRYLFYSAELESTGDYIEEEWYERWLQSQPSQRTVAQFPTHA